jgi:hypothetical protein
VSDILDRLDTVLYIISNSEMSEEDMDFCIKAVVDASQEIIGFMHGSI